MSKTNLVIVESPAKAKTIGKYLGPDYQVIASMGHIRDLPKSKLGVDIEADFEPVYTPIKGKEEVIDSLKKAAKKSKTIYLATDPDREGEAISWHLKALLDIPDDKTYRVTFNEITKKVVTESIRHPRDIDQDLVDAQQARRILDRIVGYQLSPLLWRKIRRGLSAGRVQSVVTRIVVEREREIRAFIPQESWSLDVNLSRIAPNVGSFTAHYHGEGKKKAELPNEAAADGILADLPKQTFVVSAVRRTEKQRLPAPPFTTSTLQQEASRKLGMTPRRTMSIAQQLYEGIDVAGEGTVGLITYMRTDSVRLSDEATAAAAQMITGRYGQAYYYGKPRVYKTKSGAQDGHEAIRPTDVSLAPEDIKKSLTAEQFKVYKLIWSRFLASQMSNAVYDAVSIDVTAGTHLFRATHSSLKFAGFTAVYVESKDEGEEGLGSPLPDLTEGEVVRLDKWDKAQHFTQPPPRYTEASLIKTLEEKGIGRPSTYAPTVSTILERYYVVKEGKALKPTPLGEVTTELMEDKFTDIVDPDFTAHMEEQLDEVEQGKTYWKEVLRTFYAGFSAELAQAEKDLDGTRIKIPAEETDEVCEVCGRKMVIKTGRFGRFLACPGYPECTFTKPLVIEMPGRCPKCGSRILKKTSRNGYTYYGCEHNRSANGLVCDFMTWDVPTKENCPVCGKTMFKLSGKGAKKPFCVTPDCPNFLPEDQRGYRKKKTETSSSETVSGIAADAVAEPTAKESPAGTKQTAAAGKKTGTAAKKRTSGTKKAAATKTASADKPKRQLTEAQKAALARGREIAKANREAAKQAKAPGTEE
ncbi:MAG: type I DNA topoisomerase [Clostridiales bacterium]|nr:type I DNA topoisomerase [Clostridiales bacterium]